MKTKEQLKRGIMRYASSELVPKMEAWKGVMVEAFGPAVVEAKLDSLLASGLFAGTVLQNNQSVNTEEAYRMLKETASGRWPMEIMGFKFSEGDLDKLYNFIREA